MKKALLLVVLAMACGGSEGDGEGGCWQGSRNFDTSAYDLCVVNPDEQLMEYCIDPSRTHDPRAVELVEMKRAQSCGPVVVILAPYRTQDGDPAGYGPRAVCMDACEFEARPL